MCLRHLRFHSRMPGSLFDGDDRLFRKLVPKVAVYGEYGVGESTIWVVNNTSARVLAAETDAAWIKRVKSKMKTLDRLDVSLVDVGEVGSFGRPRDYSKRANFMRYVESIWKRDRQPELVLIDGRFRVCCFLYCLRHGAPGTRILFDDYRDRPHYHLVEEFVSPDESFGRQSLFTIPDTLDKEKIDETLQQFLYVME